MDKAGEKKTLRRVACISNISLNLGILFIFKYYNFFVESFTSFLSTIGLQAHPTTLSLILPIGISFYTFQAIGYTIDVYKKQIPAARDGIAFFAFISFFPQLVAGPIERASRLYPQFLKQRTFDYQLAVSGCRLILWGFFKKIVIADGAASIVNSVWGDVAAYNASSLWIAAILFAFQIYGDFSGYSDIAIGIARLLGINLMKNFDKPYLSQSIPEFWRRWHISLTSWFRDYIYFPLGGSRCAQGKRIRNTFIVFLLSGLWHGANWTFVSWGLYHALFFLPRLISRRKHSENSRFPFASVLGTFLIVTVGWVFFRADSLSNALNFLQGMICGGGGWPLFNDILMRSTLECLAAIFLLIAAEYITKTHGEWITRFRSPSFCIIRRITYLIIAVWTVIFYSVGQSFIYFQF
ncbi:MAG: MBOAT family protein [Bacteroides sp.]|nr:MBOAT family protein [Bacteroides sp.]